ncbi:MAG: PEP-CTERM sorting domain-containing protein [Planctomycetota bacterium]
MTKTTLSMIAVAGFATAASAQITLTEIATLDLGPEFNSVTAENGDNASAIAWDGSSIFAGGYAFGTGQSAIVRYDNVLSGGAFGTRFGQLATPGNRGISGMDISNGTLAVAYDDGAGDPNGLRAFDTAGNQLWAKNIRGGSGTGFDPGFSGADSGVAWTTFGSGRRALQDSATGADIYTTGNGMIITPGGGTFWRDMDFRDTDGDMVARRSNDVIYFDRSGGNSGSTTLLVDNGENGAFVNQQNVSFVFDSALGDFVIYNDRAGSGTGQAIGDVLKAVRTDGTAEALQLINSSLNLTGSGSYDFSYDAQSGTLAILDFAGRRVSIFQVPAPSAAALLGLGGLAASRRRRA